MIKDTKAKVLYNKKLTKHYCLMGLKTGWAKFSPGQFVMVRVPPGVVFLRRPFSIMKSEGSNAIEIFYKVVGPGMPIPFEEQTFAIPELAMKLVYDSCEDAVGKIRAKKGVSGIC